MWLFKSKQSSPYLKKNRLPDVLAAIQVMAVSDYYRQSLERWTYVLSGTKEDDRSPAFERAKANWKLVFDDHPEFFRPSRARPGHYALVFRRGHSRRYDIDQQKLLTEAELPADKRRLSRAPLEHSELKSLIDIALSLHKEAIEDTVRRRWIWQLGLPFAGSLIGAALGAWSRIPA